MAPFSSYIYLPNHGQALGCHKKAPIHKICQPPAPSQSYHSMYMRTHLYEKATHIPFHVNTLTPFHVNTLTPLHEKVLIYYQPFHEMNKTMVCLIMLYYMER